MTTERESAKAEAASAHAELQQNISYLRRVVRDLFSAVPSLSSHSQRVLMDSNPYISAGRKLGLVTAPSRTSSSAQEGCD